MTDGRRLERIAATTKYDENLSDGVAKYFAEKALMFVEHGNRCLELGPAEGWGTEIFVSAGLNLEILEGSRTLAQNLQKKFPSLVIHNSLFELWQPNSSFDVIFASHVLEHVGDPHALLNLISSWLKPRGVLLLSTPNSESLHRQIGVATKLITSTKELTQGDLEVGHFRVFDHVELRSLLESSGFDVEEESGFFLKPLSAAQLSKLDDDAIAVLMKAGELFPRIAADTFFVARKG